MININERFLNALEFFCYRLQKNWWQLMVQENQYLIYWRE